MAENLATDSLLLVSQKRMGIFPLSPAMPTRKTHKIQVQKNRHRTSAYIWLHHPATLTWYWMQWCKTSDCWTSRQQQQLCDWFGTDGLLVHDEHAQQVRYHQTGIPHGCVNRCQSWGTSHRNDCVKGLHRHNQTATVVLSCSIKFESMRKQHIVAATAVRILRQKRKISNKKRKISNKNGKKKPLW